MGLSVRRHLRRPMLGVVGRSGAFEANSDTPVNAGGPASTFIFTSAAPGDGSATVTWTPAPAPRGCSVTGYTVTCLDTVTRAEISVPAGAGSASATVIGLTNADRQQVRLEAACSDGSIVLAWPRHVSITPAPGGTVPDVAAQAPDFVSLTGAEQEATATWTAAVPGAGDLLTAYAVTWINLTSGVLFRDITGPGALSDTATGLTDGDEYQVVLSAVFSQAGTVLAIPGNRTVVPAYIPDLPGAPVDVSAEAGCLSAIVTWNDAALDDGRSRPTEHTITYLDLDNEARSGSVDTGSARTSGTVEGLLAGHRYAISVVASNSAGPSPASEPATPITPFATPDAPTDVVAVRGGGGSATLTWTAPAADGGSPVTGYLVVASRTDGVPDEDGSPDGDSSDADADVRCVTWGPATIFAVAGLHTGAEYTFTVSAINAGGPGSPSERSAAVVPAAVPGRPAQLVAAAADAAVELSWTVPDTGGSPITGYRIVQLDREGAPDSGVTVSSVTVAGPAPAARMGDLVAGDSYRFTVAAINDVGAGTSSDPCEPVTPYTTPGPPREVTAVADADGLPVVSWAAPDSDGWRPILGYLIGYTECTAPRESDDSAESGDSGGQLTVGADDRSLTLTGLAVGGRYAVTVTAVNVAGPGVAAEVIDPVTVCGVPGPPTEVSTLVGAGWVAAGWEPPATDGGSPITGYLVTYGNLARPEDTVEHQIGPDQHTDLADASDGVVLGASYTVRLRATTRFGSADSPDTPPVVPYGPPSAPGRITATAGDRAATLTWTAPVEDGFAEIRGYEITVSDRTTSSSAVVAAGPRSSRTVTGLRNEHRYAFTVAAINAAGASPSSEPSAVVTPQGALTLTGSTLPRVVRVGLEVDAVPFFLTLSRPGAVTVSLTRGATVLASTSIAAAAAPGTVSGAMTVHPTSSAQLGDYFWYVRDAATGAVLGSQAVRLKQPSRLALGATRLRSAVTVSAPAMARSVASGEVIPWVEEQGRPPQVGGDGPVGVRGIRADGHAYVQVTVRLPHRLESRLLADAPVTPQVSGADPTPTPAGRWRSGARGALFGALRRGSPGDPARAARSSLCAGRTQVGAGRLRSKIADSTFKVVDRLLWVIVVSAWD